MEPVRSLLRLSWGVPLAGLRQAGRAWEAAAAGAPSPRALGRAALDLLPEPVQGLAAALPAPAGGLAFQELGNKLEAFSCFQLAPPLAGSGRGELDRRIAEARGLASYRSLWRVEGLGVRFAEAAWRQGEAPRGLLQGDLPARALLPLHTGLGLALAERLVAGAAEQELGEALARWAELCRANARSGCELAVLEAVGLVARTLHPHRLALFDHLLAPFGEPVRAAFWHGVGRGLYFAPTHALPDVLPVVLGGGAARRAAEKALAEPPHDLGRANAVAGLAWALTLVNIRHPQILEAFLADCSDLFEPGDAVAHGITRAVAVWLWATGGEAATDPFCRHRPSGCARRWERWVRGPCDRELPDLAAQLAASRFGDLFHVQPPAAPRAPRGAGR
jgi:hypothetical protein